MHTKNVEIEKLRALAIIFVIFWHYCDITLDVVHLNRAYYATWTGVDLFFCISGFVITKSLLSMLAAPRLRSFLANFYIKRISRITPSACLCVGSALVLAYVTSKFVGPEFFADTRRDALPALLNYANFAYFFKVRNHGGTLLGIFWSLSLEEQFYLVIPLLVWSFRRRLRLLGCLLLPFAVWQFLKPRDSWNVLLWAVRTDGLIYGVLIALAESRIPALYDGARRIVSRLRPVVALVLAPLLIFALAVVASGVGREFTTRSTGWAAIAGAALVLLASLDCNTIVPGACATRILNWIGGRSYSLYLYHNIVLVVMKALNMKVLHIGLRISNPLYYAFLLSTAAVLGALCELNFRLVEAPLRNAGRRLADRHFPIGSVKPG